MKYITTILVLLISLSGWAQDYEWSIAAGGTGDDQSRSVITDASNNVYTTGVFQGTVDFDPGSGTFDLASAGDWDVYVQKLDPAGNLLWAVSFGNASNDISQSIDTDDLGNIYVLAAFSGTIDVDPSAGTTLLSSNNNSLDALIIKLDPSGNLIWAKHYGGNEWDIPNDIHVDASGDLNIVGFYRQTVDFDPGAGVSNLTSQDEEDIFIQKLDSDGNFLWAKTVGGLENQVANGIDSDLLGNLFITGYFTEITDFDPGPGTVNLVAQSIASEAFVLKLDSDGNYIWVKSFQSISSSMGSSLAVSATGEVYTTGYFQGTCDFDPGPGVSNITTQGGTDIYIQKMDSDGNFLWAHEFGGAENDEGRSVFVDDFGDVYTTGFFEGTIDFEPGSGTTNLTSGFLDTDVFIQKLDPQGELIWAKSFGGENHDFGRSICVSGLADVYTIGEFKATADFDPETAVDEITSAGLDDIFVHKMSQCLKSTGTDIQTACDSFTWIDGNTYTASNNSATFTLTNAAGCDSLVTLDLTIEDVSDISTSTTDLTIIAANTNATYQWLDCDNGYTVITGETSQTYTATANGNYAVELTENGCVDTSACVEISSVGIIENNFGNKLKVYPNPTKGNFSIDLGAVHESSVVFITDNSGRMIEEHTVLESQLLKLSIAEPAGVYFVSIQAGNKKAVIRLIKQ
jgi:hypothetical protein